MSTSSITGMSVGSSRLTTGAAIIAKPIPADPWTKAETQHRHADDEKRRHAHGRAHFQRARCSGSRSGRSCAARRGRHDATREVTGAVELHLPVPAHRPATLEAEPAVDDDRLDLVTVRPAKRELPRQVPGGHELGHREVDDEQVSGCGPPRAISPTLPPRPTASAPPAGPARATSSFPPLDESPRTAIVCARRCAVSAAWADQREGVATSAMGAQATRAELVEKQGRSKYRVSLPQARDRVVADGAASCRAAG